MEDWGPLGAAGFAACVWAHMWPTLQRSSDSDFGQNVVSFPFTDFDVL